MEKAVKHLVLNNSKIYKIVHLFTDLNEFQCYASLDISLRVERGNEGKWVVISSEIKEVGPVAVKPIGVNKSQF